MTDVVRINATLDRPLLVRVDHYAARNAEDRSTAIRQLLGFAVRQLAKEDAMRAYRQGRLTLRQFAEALDVDIWAAHDLLASEGVAIAQGSRTETAADLDAVVDTTLPTRARKPRSRRRSSPR
jgi:uncharacterized protein UPF0175